MSVIEVKDLKKYFGKIKAVDGVSLSVDKGEVFGFLGPNGAGKTTTIRCMMDFVRPTEGSITLLDKNSHYDSVDIKKDVGYLAGGTRLYGKWTGQDHINFIRRTGKSKEDMTDELIKRLDFDPSRKVKTLSSGNRQKLGVIMAFMLKPKLLILDEPTLALDPLLQHEIYQILSEVTNNGTTVFMSSHNLAEVERVCNRAGIIRNGKIVAIENIHSLKEKRMYTVQVFFSDVCDMNAFRLEGVEVKKEYPGGVTLKVTGDINPLLKKLINCPVRDLEIEHASLEEIFLESYE
ncbi:MAG: ABC transporter ATP-binding protein [Patescibacteria group bacterium]